LTERFLDDLAKNKHDQAMTDRLQYADFFSDPECPVAVLDRDPQPVYPRHSHQFTELILITGGHGLHCIKKAAFKLSEGDVFVIGPDVVHEYRDPDHLALVNILYDPEALGLPTPELRALPGYHALFQLEPAYRRHHRFASRLRLDREELHHVLQPIRLMQAELQEKPPGWRGMVRSNLLQTVTLLCRSYGQTRQPASQNLLRIGRAISYLEDHFTEEITLEQLAAIAHMSPRNFARVFRSAMHASPIDCLIRLRINRAQRLLLEDRLNITEIAWQCGFKDSNYFTRQFRRITGTAPRDYRKKPGSDSLSSAQSDGARSSVRRDSSARP